MKKKPATTLRSTPRASTGEPLDDAQVNAVRNLAKTLIGWTTQKELLNQLEAEGKLLNADRRWKADFDKILRLTEHSRIPMQAHHEEVLRRTLRKGLCEKFHKKDEELDSHTASLSASNESMREVLGLLNGTSHKKPQPEPGPDDEERKRTAERRWQYIQNHPIRGVEILFMLKGAVGFDWFLDVLEETRLTFSRDEPSFKLSQLLAASPAPNTKEPSPAMERAVCSFWEIYAPEKGYWFKKIALEVRAFSTVAGFDATAHWSVFGVKHVEKLQDLGLLNEIGISIPARAYQLGVEEFAFKFIGDTFSFCVRLSEHGLDFLHEMASTQHVVVKKAEPAPIGSVFSGVQLLEMFYRQLQPRQKTEESKHAGAPNGITGLGGKAMFFYPAMPNGFIKSKEMDKYTIKVTVPAKVDTDSHISELEGKLKSNPADAKSYAELAAVYSHLGRLQDAIRWLEIGIGKAPADPDVHGMKAEILSKMGRFDEALTLYRKAEKLCPKRNSRIKSSVQNGMGVCLHELGKDDEALPHFQTAARLEPSKANFQFNLSMAFAAVGRFSDALAPAKRAVELAPDDGRMAMHLAVLFLDDRPLDAIPHAEKATQLSPNSADAHELLGQLFAKTNQHEKAVASLQRAVKIEETARRYDLLGASLGDLDRWPEAEVAFRRGAELEPNNSGILANLGATVANQRRFAEAIQFFERAVSANPSNVAAEQNLARLRDLVAS